MKSNDKNGRGEVPLDELDGAVIRSAVLMASLLRRQRCGLLVNVKTDARAAALRHLSASGTVTVREWPPYIHARMAQGGR